MTGGRDASTVSPAPIPFPDQGDRGEPDPPQLNLELRALNAIGIRLSAERDPQVLLELILSTSRELTRSDAGSLYLVERDETGSQRLRFVLVQNDSLSVPFEAAVLPIDSQSIAGHVAVTGQIVNLADAYVPPPGSPFRIDATFDQSVGYRSKSMLAVPMRTAKGEMVGVIQLINRRPPGRSRFSSAEEIEQNALSFPARFEDLVASLGSQAAVALENARLYRRLEAALADLETSQARVLQSERLRALGEMAAGIAHDFNNLLSIILGRTQLMLQQSLDANLRVQLQTVETAAIDAAHTVRRIQEFTRVRKLLPTDAVDLNHVVEEVMELTRPVWKDAAHAAGISYEVRHEPGSVPPVAGDAPALREALLNLVLNALDAMPTGGRLTLTTGSDAESAWCAVSDTGHGMTPEVQRRVFEPFFTSKIARGSGLGLSVVYGIVARHDGRIDLRSEAGRGSTFVIRLPRRAPVDDAPHSDPGSRTGRPAHVLVIEDDTRVREILAEQLAAAGHTVVACEDGRAGLARFGEQGFDLVITDLSLPGLSGWDIVEHVRASRPEVPVALVTGWADRIDAGAARARGVDFLVAKPFTLPQVQTLVEHALLARTPLRIAPTR